MVRIGLISDTHGLLRPEACEFLQGCDHIIHAGDIDEPRVLEELESICSVTAVRGNNDKGAWSRKIAESEVVELGGKLIYVIHDISMIDVDPQAANIDVVIYGHSHKPLIEQREGVLYINPGSAGPRRFKLPVSVAEIVVSRGRIEPRVFEIELPAK
jgi:uncharacterized protein